MSGRGLLRYCHLLFTFPDIICILTAEFILHGRMNLVSNGRVVQSFMDLLHHAEEGRKNQNMYMYFLLNLLFNMSIGSLKKQTSHISQRPYSSFRC